MLAVAAAPAIVKAENVMKVWVPNQELIVPELSVNKWYHVTAKRVDGELVVMIDGKPADRNSPVIVTQNNGFINVECSSPSTLVTDLTIVNAVLKGKGNEHMTASLWTKTA